MLLMFVSLYATRFMYLHVFMYLHLYMYVFYVFALSTQRTCEYCT